MAWFLIAYMFPVECKFKKITEAIPGSIDANDLFAYSKYTEYLWEEESTACLINCPSHIFKTFASYPIKSNTNELWLWPSHGKAHAPQPLQYLPPKFNLYNGSLKRNLIENTKSCSKTKTLREDFD